MFLFWLLNSPYHSSLNGKEAAIRITPKIWGFTWPEGTRVFAVAPCGSKRPWLARLTKIMLPLPVHRNRGILTSLLFYERAQCSKSHVINIFTSEESRVYFNVQFYTKCAVLNPFVQFLKLKCAVTKLTKILYNLKTVFSFTRFPCGCSRCQKCFYWASKLQKF